MLKHKAKTFILTLGLFGLIIGSVFALCYAPFMKMVSVHSAVETSHMTANAQQCCENKTGTHMFTTLGTAINNVSATKDMSALLGLGVLFLLISFFENARIQAGLKFLFARRFILRTYDYLVLFFSRGVLHPKLYNA